jgi:ABC-type transporter Mla MlaB component
MRTRTHTAQSPATPRFRAVTRRYRIVVELDVRGEIDRHATMCLKYAIEDALTWGAEMIVVDLRDLVAIDDGALALFAWARAACYGCDAELGLLICPGEHHYAIAEAFNRSGLGAGLQFAAGETL